MPRALFMITTAIVCAALAQPVNADPTVWLVPTSDYTTYRVHARNDGLVCCGELYVRPEDAERWDFVNLPPFDLFSGMEYRIIDKPGYPDWPWNGWGQAIWSFPLGDMWAPFNEIVGEFHGEGALFFSVPDGIDEQAIFVWSGVIPNWALLTASYKTCPGDFNGDGFVNNSDLLYMLARWGAPYDNNDFLDLIGNWSEVPFGCYDGPE